MIGSKELSVELTLLTENSSPPRLVTGTRVVHVMVYAPGIVLAPVLNAVICDWMGKISK